MKTYRVNPTQTPKTKIAIYRMINYKGEVGYNVQVKANATTVSDTGFIATKAKAYHEANNIKRGYDISGIKATISDRT